MELVATSLRSFFRFLRVEGLYFDRLDDAVPMFPHRRSCLVRDLDAGSFEQLVASLDSSSARGLRDQAIICALARTTTVEASERAEEHSGRFGVVLGPDPAMGDCCLTVWPRACR